MLLVIDLFDADKPSTLSWRLEYSERQANSYTSSHCCLQTLFAVVLDQDM